jgi:hypothetical protein
MLSFFIPFASPVFAVSTSEGLQQTISQVNEGGNTLPADTSDKIPAKIGTFIGGLLAFVGTLFFVLIIYAGLKWMLAMGNDQQIEQSKDLISAAVIGLIIVLSAYAITSFIGGLLVK